MCQNRCGKFSTPMGLVYWPSGQVISDEPHSFALIPFRDPGYPNWDLLISYPDLSSHEFLQASKITLGPSLIKASNRSSWW